MLPYKVLKFFDDVTSALVAVLLALLAVYAGYALWDNQQVYAAAEEVQASLLTLKPQEGGVPFAELRAVNADVCAWVTLDGTGVDYPVVQGKDNLTYVNTDVYGNFSLAGTIFLDTRCAPDFAGGYSLLYGHHMVSGQMFGDLEKYQDAAFLREHRTGTLLLPAGACTLAVFACVPLMGIVSVKLNQRLRARFRQQRIQIGELNATIEDSLLGQGVVKAFAAEEQERAKFEQGN